METAIAMNLVKFDKPVYELVLLVGGVLVFRGLSVYLLYLAFLVR